MGKSKFAWAILDTRTGNRNQILGVLSQLKLRYRIIEIKYNFLAHLPNFFFQIFNNTIHIGSIKKLNKEPSPDIIISCGRRTATVALELKKIFNYKPFCVHLMYPQYTFLKNNFDLIFTPQHDRIKQKKNIKKFLGSPSNIKLIKNIEHSFIKPVFFLLVGGDHGNFKLSVREINKILKSIIKRLDNRGSLLITTSRRSSDHLIERINYLKSKYNIIKEVYHPKTSKKNNPYFRNLSIAKEIVVTGDSMSMVSDACETKKPVRIYYNKNFCSNKHINFCEKLIEKNYA
ncbi:MAG: hypothetical protein CFH34_01420, partial [Alphaproteobacteria bacterium MarineAlpha9_Bin4]